MLVTPDELAKYMDLRFDNRQNDSAEMVIAGIQNEIETFIRRPLELAEVTEEYTIPDDFGLVSPYAYFYTTNSTSISTNTLAQVVEPGYSLRVRNAPVVEIDQVRVKSQYTNTWRTMRAGDNYTKQRWGIILYRALANDIVEITYTGGLDGEHLPYIKLLILRAAAREMENMVDDVVGIKDLNTRQITIREIGLTDKELQSLKRLKRKMV